MLLNDRDFLLSFVGRKDQEGLVFLFSLQNPPFIDMEYE